LESKLHKAHLLKKGIECVSAPELNLATIPEGGEVTVKLTRCGQKKIFEIAVIRGRADEPSTGA
jgi:hypothetical protein